MLLALLVGFWLPAGLAAIIFAGVRGFLLNLGGLLLLGRLAGIPATALVPVVILGLAVALGVQQVPEAGSPLPKAAAYGFLLAAVVAALLARPTAGLLTLAGAESVVFLASPRRQLMRYLYATMSLLLAGLVANFWVWRLIFF
ncbi:MAG: hypothetical protein D9V47_13575 [Clostridia bacterium]|nr:MAG: hypothetical protein D9V47_13575 [Clostridia bacterium]